MRLEGKVALISGGARGQGAAEAKLFAQEGAKVVFGDVLDQEGKQVEAEINESGGEATYVHLDVSKEKDWIAIIDTAVTRFGKLDILISKAALFASVSHKPFLDIQVEEWDRVMAVNVRGPWLCAKAAVPEMRKNGYGKIVNIASGSLFKGAPNYLHYVTSKGAILAMSRSMSREVGGDGICVNTLAPGLTMSEGVLESDEYLAGRDAIMVSRALKRYQEPEDLTGAMLFLVSSDSDFMTGQCMTVDGGLVPAR